MASLPARIPALTVRNPWAWSAVTPPPERRKPVENRGRRMAYCGPIWWHAGARSRWDPAGADSPLVQAAWSEYVRTIPGWPGLPASDITLGRKTTLMPFGAITALVEVAGCHDADSCRAQRPEWAPDANGPLRPRWQWCSPWAVSGQWHIELANVQPLPEPVPCRGALGLWRLPDVLLAQARKQLEATRA